MKYDPSLELQKGIVDVLVPAIAPYKVYDNVPGTAQFPYVTIGQDQLLDNRAECIDAVEAFANIHIWSRKPGKVEVKEITKKVILALYTEISLQNGFKVVDVSVDGLTHLSDPDGMTSHSVVTMRYLIEAP